VEEILGESGEAPAVAGVRIRNIKTGQLSDIPADGVFVAIGHAPVADLAGGQLRMTRAGYMRTEKGSTATSIPEVFAAGDVADEVFRQAITAAGLDCMAALEAQRFLAEKEGESVGVAAE
jgi:thioredoxin reductase (NADPH)